MARGIVALCSSSCVAWLAIVGCIAGLDDSGSSDGVDSIGVGGSISGLAGSSTGGAGTGGDQAGSAASSGAPDAGLVGSSQGGTPAVAGSAGGDSGASGSSGNSGGLGSGGSGGDSGGAGLGGSAGAQAGTGNLAGSGGSSSGAGTGGGSGSGNTLEHKLCHEKCLSSADCTVFGSDQGYACNAGTGRCERPRDPCLADVECLPLFSLWFFDCMSDADCFLFSDDVCVAVTGGGKCARLVPEAGCMDSTPDQVLMPRLGTPGSVLVCANESLVCREGSCVPGCRSDLECTPERNGSLCDEQTRTCKCVDDIDCQGQGVSHCDVASGTCQCTRDLDCGDVLDADVCASGRCGCSSAAACQGERRFSGTSYVCE